MQLGKKVVIVKEGEIFLHPRDVLVDIYSFCIIILHATYHNKSRDRKGVVDRVSEQRPAGQSDVLRQRQRNNTR